IENWIAQNCREILDFRYNTAAMGHSMDVCLRQQDAHVVPPSAFRMISATLIGPKGSFFQSLRTEQLLHPGGDLWAEAAPRQNRHDPVAFPAPTGDYLCPSQNKPEYYRAPPCH